MLQLFDTWGIHDFVMLNALASIPASFSAIGLVNENFRGVFLNLNLLTFFPKLTVI